MEYFSKEDVDIVVKQRKKTIIMLAVISFIFVFASLGFILWYRTLPYNSSTIKIIKIFHYTFTGIFVIVLFMYIGIFYRRVNKRYIFQNNMLTGKKETSVGTFIEYNEEIQDKDGVEFKSLIFLEWNKYKKEFFERKVLVFYDKDFPEIEKDVKVEYTTQSNALIEYKILGKDEKSAENNQ